MIKYTIYTENTNLKGITKALNNSKIIDGCYTIIKTLGYWKGKAEHSLKIEILLPKYYNASLAILQGISPEDEIEGMLAVQMIGVHNLAMETLKRAMISDQTFEGKEANVNQASKALRIFVSQMEALKKYRTGGQQKMIVEHVHVNDGGQAVIGDVSRGGGDDKKK